MEPARILVVEDDRNARLALAEILREEGFTVETAAEGREALAKLGPFAPQVMLTDVMLPDLDGVALKALASAQPHPPAVIMMTAREDWWDQSIEMGDTLRKPIQLPLLFDAITRALARPTHRAPVPRGY